MNLKNKVTNKINNKALATYKETVQHKHATLSILMWLLAVCIGLTMLIMLPNNANNGTISLNATGGNITGSGSETDPFIINDAQDLIAFADSANRTTYWASGTYAKLGADITVTANDLSTNGLTNTDGTYTWTPIGIDIDTPYQGTFDGDGHVITFENKVTIDKQYSGLFGYISGSHISGSHIRNLSIDWKQGLHTTYNDANVYVGGIVGYFGASSIANLQSSGNIVVQNYSGTAYVGGLSGFCSAGDDIYSLSNSCNIAVEASNIFAGGFWGYTKTSSHTIENGYATGSIKAKGGGSINVGGLVGCHEYDQINTCYSAVDIEIEIYTRANVSVNVGGLFGVLLEGYIEKCYNLGNINVDTSLINLEADVYVGGLLGNIENSVILNCFNAGSKIACKISNAIVSSIVGRADGATLKDCFSILDASSTLSSAELTNALVGLSDNDIEIESCFYDIIGDVVTTAPNEFYVEGLESLASKQNTFSSDPFTDLLGIEHNWTSEWNFTSIWALNPAFNNGYPYLKDISAPPTKVLITLNLTNNSDANVLIVISRIDSVVMFRLSVGDSKSYLFDGNLTDVLAITIIGAEVSSNPTAVGGDLSIISSSKLSFTPNCKNSTININI